MSAGRELRGLAVHAKDRPACVKPYGPFASRLQCLRCGATWWSQTDHPSWCPNCRPIRRVVNGQAETEDAIAADITAQRPGEKGGA
jgi:hypothetical protein